MVGAVFFVYDSATLYIHSSSLYSNQALSGGAVSAVYESTVRIDNSSLLYNSGAFGTHCFTYFVLVS